MGKAITFDAGGISLKPALKMQDMKGDMAGGAAVIAGTAAVAELGLPVRVVAVVAAAENLVGGDSFRPGDILRAANGKTIGANIAENHPILCQRLLALGHLLRPDVLGWIIGGLLLAIDGLLRPAEALFQRCQLRRVFPPHPDSAGSGLFLALY